MNSIVSLDEIVELKKGSKLDFTTVQSLDSQRYIQIDDLRNDTNLKYTTGMGTGVDPDDVVIAWDGANAGTVGYGLSGVIGSTLVRLRLKDKNFLGPYIGRFLGGQFSYLRGQCTGATIPHLDGKTLRNLRLEKVSKEDQKRVVDILDKADSLRLKRKQSRAHLDDLLRATFIDMFGDPLLNPKGFDIMILEKAFTKHKAGTKCGPFGSALKKHEYTDQGVPVWTMANIGDNRFIPDGCLFITEKKYCDLEGYSVEPGDIIISRAGTVGKMCVVDRRSERSIISTNLIRLSLDKRIIEPQYFTFLMTQFPGRVGRLKTGADGAYTFMNTGILSKLELPQPPVELQRQFLNIRDVVKNIQIKETQQLSDMDNQFNALMQRYFE